MSWHRCGRALAWGVSESLLVSVSLAEGSLCPTFCHLCQVCATWWASRWQWTSHSQALASPDVLVYMTNEQKAVILSFHGICFEIALMHHEKVSKAFHCSDLRLRALLSDFHLENPLQTITKAPTVLRGHFPHSLLQSLETEAWQLAHISVAQLCS